MLKVSNGLISSPMCWGFNHFTWIDRVTYQGEDIMPIYARFVDKYYEEGFRGAHRVKFDLFKRYGLIAAAGDRHLVEFLPGAWYLKDRRQWRSGSSR